MDKIYITAAVLCVILAVAIVLWVKTAREIIKMLKEQEENNG